MSDKKYPYIGRSAQGNKYVVVSGCLIYSLLIKSWLHEAHGFAPMDNITREYLANTCGEVKDERHAKFIKALAVNAGYQANDVLYPPRGFFSIDSDGLYFWEEESTSKNNGEKLITIPQPPEGRNMQTDDEWPKVGDEALLVSNGVVAFNNRPVIITYIGDGVGCYKDLSSNRECTFSSRETVFSKPKTPEEELREEIASLLDSYVDSEKTRGYFVGKIIEITKRDK